jgi:hypothetical protein
MSHKPPYVKLRLVGHWFTFPAIVGREREQQKAVSFALHFGRVSDAMLFSRREAAACLREVRTWGRYYRLTVIKP